MRVCVCVCVCTIIFENNILRAMKRFGVQRALKSRIFKRIEDNKSLAV